MGISFIDYDKNVQWAICNAIGMEHHLIDEMMKDKEGLEIKFVINGVELDFVRVFNSLVASMEFSAKERAKEEAKKIFLQKFDTTDILYKVQNDLTMLLDSIENSINDYEFGKIGE